MKFMNKKEDVLDIRMTPYGEYLLSQGRFKPEYYAFYDDNILYESQYTGQSHSDKQNDIEPRIQENTPQPTTQVVFSDRDVFVRKGFSGLLGEVMSETVVEEVETPTTLGTAVMGGISLTGYLGAASTTTTSTGATTSTGTTTTAASAGSLAGVTPSTAGPSLGTPSTGLGIGAITAPAAGPMAKYVGGKVPHWSTVPTYVETTVYTVEGEGGIAQDKISITSEYFDRHRYGPQHSLGTSDILKTNAPAFSVSMFRGEISGSSRTVTNSTTHTMNIPQLDVTLTYKINVVNNSELISDSVLAVEYPNGQFLDINPEIALSQIIERNAEFTKENFDIEVFEVEEGVMPGLDATTEKLRPLRFKKPRNLVQGGVLLDDDEVPEPLEAPPTTRDVEYYFDIRTDEDISEALICASISILESKGLYVDTEIVCEDAKNISLVDIYSTDASSEPCPEDGPGGDPCDDNGSVY